MTRMIGLALRGAMGGESMGPCLMILGPIIAICALCVIWKYCCRCRIRDCACIKRLLRCCGTDPFDDFKMMILIHEVKFTSTSKFATFVRVRAGDMVVETEQSKEGRFHETVCLEVEQGSPCVEFELCKDRKVIASLKMNIMKDILKVENGEAEVKSVMEKVFNMTTSKSKSTVLNPKITLTFADEDIGESQNALLEGMDVNHETEWMLKQQLQKIGQEGEGQEGGKHKDISEMELLARGCAGPVEKFSKMGEKKRVYLAVIGPPTKKKYGLHIWKSEKDFSDGKAPSDEVELLKITGITPDPGRAEVFQVNYMDDNKARANFKFNRVDRGRDVWVEMLQMLVKKAHEERQKKHDKKHHK